MHFRGLDLNLLVALDALLDEGSVTAAARRLHLSQSAMSGALGRLREHFRDPLLVQVGRRMQPTPRARELGVAVHSILVQVDTSMSGQPPFDPQSVQRNLRIAASDYTIEILLIEVQRLLGSSHAPGLTLHIVPLSENAMEDLDRGEIDLLILPDHYQRPSHPSVPLFEDQLVCVAANDHPLKGSHISLRDFKSADHVLFQPRPGHMIAFDLWLQQNYHFEPSVKLVLPNYTPLLQAVAGTRRIATVPARLAQRHARHLPIRLLQPRFRMPVLKEIMQWHEAFSIDAGFAWLRQFIIDTAGRLDAVAPSGQDRLPV